MRNEVSFMSAREGLTLLIELYPEIKTCQELIHKSFWDGIINVAEAQYLNMVPSVCLNVSTENVFAAFGDRD